MSLSDIHAANSCGFTRSEWVAMYRRTGYTLPNVPPADYGRAVLGQCDPAANAFAADLLAGKAPSGLLVTGATGRGKTYLACAVMRAASASMSIGLATDAEIVREAKAAFGRRGVAERDVINVFCAPSLLAIDDFGKASYASEWALQLLFEIVDRRLKQRRATIVTTQYDAQGLLKALTLPDGDGETAKAILSRLRAFRRIHLAGPDMRRAS